MGTTFRAVPPTPLPWPGGPTARNTPCRLRSLGGPEKLDSLVKQN